MFHAYLEAQDCTHQPWHCQDGKGGKNDDADCFLLDSPSLFSLSCRLLHFHTLYSNKTVLTEDIMIPSSPEVHISSLSSSSLLVSHLSYSTSGCFLNPFPFVCLVSLVLLYFPLLLLSQMYWNPSYF